VLVVDDQDLVRTGLRMILELGGVEVVGEAAEGAAAVAAEEELRPDVVLMDLRMPGGDGVPAIRALAAAGSTCRVLVLTTYDGDADVLPAIEAGAAGYLLKDTPRAELVAAVRAAARGESVLAPSVVSRLMGRVRMHGTPTQDPLSPREREILRQVADGRTNREVAARLFISEATVKTHLLHLYGKLGVNDRAAAVAAGYERGLLTAGQRHH
jgi:DNA-binding NarL/FixJ family response regulator